MHWSAQSVLPAHKMQLPVLGCRYVNTTAVKSKISFIDGDKGVLRYRGYPIEQLAERSNFLEVPIIGQFVSTGNCCAYVLFCCGGATWCAAGNRIPI